MPTRLLGTIKASVSDYKWMFRQACVRSKFLYWAVHADRIEAYSLSPVAKRRSYSEFNRYFLSDIDIKHDSVFHLLIDASRIHYILQTMTPAKPKNPVRIQIFGDISQGGEIMDPKLRIQRDLTWQAYVTTVKIPEVLNEIQDRFTDYGYVDAQQADPYRVAIRTPVSEIERLVSFMDDKFEKGLYAIDIRDGQLGLSLPEEYGLGSIVFQPYSVHGPNTRKYFTEDFKRVFDRLNGDVLIHVDPEGEDLAVVHTDRRGAIIRHAIESIGVNGKLTLRNQDPSESG